MSIQKIAKQILSASETSFDQLPEDKQKLIKKLKLEHKVVQVFDGIHGSIIIINDHRFDKNDVKTLVADKNFRWLDASPGEDKIAIGF